MIFKGLKIASYILLLSVLTSCSGYEKLLKSSDYQLKYEKAKTYYADEEYVKAGTLFEQILPVFRGTNKADSIQFYMAYSTYYQQSYYTATFYFRQLTANYPTSDFIEESMYMIGYCNYMVSPRPSLDQQQTYKAIEAFQFFLIKYPNSEWADNARKLIAELNDKLVEKSFKSAKLYYDLEEYKSSIIALNNSLAEYPDTKYRERILYLILQSRYLLASNSVAEKQQERYQSTVDDYYSFIAEFPESNYRNDADKIYNLASQKVSSNQEEL